MGCGHGSDPTLLWLWCRLAAPAPIGPLVWEPPYAAGKTIEETKKKKKKERKPERHEFECRLGDEKVNN